VNETQPPALTRTARAGLISGSTFGLIAVAGLSAQAKHPLAAFGLSLVAASALIVTPRLVGGVALALSINRFFELPPVARYAELTVKGWLLLLGPLQALLIQGGWFLRGWNAAVGTTLFVIGLVLLGLLILGNILFWATWRSPADESGQEIDMIDLHARRFGRFFGPDPLWAVAGFLFFTGTLFQFLDAMLVE
jgi:hypothetical protein